MAKRWNLIEGTRADVLKVHGQLIDEIDGDPESDEAVCIAACIECGAVFERTDAIDAHGRDYEHFSQKHPGDGSCCPQEVDDDKPAA